METKASTSYGQLVLTRRRDCYYGPVPNVRAGIGTRSAGPPGRSVVVLFAQDSCHRPSQRSMTSSNRLPHSTLEDQRKLRVVSC